LIREANDTFPCFGSTCSVAVGSESGAVGSATAAALASARTYMLAWHQRFSRFLPESELSQLNADPRAVVPISRIMSRFLLAAIAAADASGGLVDATLLSEIETAGYVGDLAEGVPLAEAIAAAPAPKPARGRLDGRWRAVSVDLERLTVRRPPGLRFDSGGVAKGLFADLLGGSLRDHASFAVECAGDMSLGGTAAQPRPVRVTSPFDGSVLQSFEIAGGGVATSGIGRRSWRRPGGAPAHHLLDPSTGLPAFTGVVQATAVAPSALVAEIRAKAAVLSGPEVGLQWLCDGGVLVLDDGDVQRIDPAVSFAAAAA
jgi:thiamine biosynthesis lipoprotein